MASVSLPNSVTDIFRKDLDAIQGFLDSGHDILTINHDWFHGNVIAQGDVQDSATFRVVDLFSIKHGFCLTHDVLLFRKSIQQVHGFTRDAILGVIQQNILHLEGKLVEPLRVLGKEIFHLHVLHDGVVSLEGLPSGTTGEFCHTVDAGML
jgi:hypothetical protein